MHNKKILIVGGGTAGWMTALIMANTWQRQPLDITLMESPAVGTIGVGEGSTPALKTFFETLGIADSEWMPECNATYKCGIRFDNWSTKPGFESYFHPFASLLDKHSLPIFMHNAQARVAGAQVEAHPDKFFIAAYLAQQGRGPKGGDYFPFDVHYGYHFDAALLGRFLRRKAEALGVNYLQRHLRSVELNEAGDIASVVCDQGEKLGADFFVDATGFASLLLQQSLAVPFKSYANNLFNDAAVAMPSAIAQDAPLPSFTLARALKHGWAWQIPLTQRFGNGYVYSSAFCSADEAERELRERLGLLDADIPVRHLTMKIGRVEQHWSRNCLAVGLSQGFIEPLEATALFLVQQTAAIFVELFTRGNFSNEFCSEFNRRINGYFDGTRDYIVTHYKTSSRSDSEYWRANTANPRDVSEAMLQLYSAWMAGKDLASEVNRLHLAQYYPVPSWYCILAGMGIFPNANNLRQPNTREASFDLDNVQNFLNRCAPNYADHREQLARLRS